MAPDQISQPIHGDDFDAESELLDSLDDDGLPPYAMTAEGARWLTEVKARWGWAPLSIPSTTGASAYRPDSGQ